MDAEFDPFSTLLK